MQHTLSKDLIAISSMLLMAQERGEVIRLAGELNALIESAMKIITIFQLQQKKRRRLLSNSLNKRLIICRKHLKKNLFQTVASDASYSDRVAKTEFITKSDTAGTDITFQFATKILIKRKNCLL